MTLEMTAEEMAGLARLADVGELAGTALHEFNNFLNTVLLHVAILKSELPPEQADDLEQIRKQGSEVAALIKQVQRYRQQYTAVPRPIDLHGVLQAAVEEMRRFAIPGNASSPDADPLMTLDLASHLPPVKALLPDLTRLCMFLLTQAARVSSSSAGVRVRTSVTGDRIGLRVTDAGQSLTQEQLTQVFEPNGPHRDGTSGLLLSACKRLVKRLEGKISAESRPGEGLSVLVELPSAT